jgi:hypothetical protein
VALLGVLEGIAVAIALSILNVFRRGASKRKITRPGSCSGVRGHLAVVLAWAAGRDQIRALAAAEPRPQPNGRGGRLAR